MLCPNAVDENPPCIIVPPEDKVAFLNPMANITVMCVANADSVYWKVNGTALNTLNNTDLKSDKDVDGSSNSMCTLYIRAKAKYNGTVVQCVASMPGGGFDESQNASILIQGNYKMHIL